MLMVFFLLPSAAAWADDAKAIIEKEAQTAPKSEFDNLKAEWEAVREQQIRMIREKEDQLEKLKEELFAKVKAANPSTVPQTGAEKPATQGSPGRILPVDTANAESLVNSPEFEAQKAAFRTEREKFFREINRQKENLRRLQRTFDEKTKQFEADRARFERQKTAAS